MIHTCRQIHHEALPIFYAHTTFDFGALAEWPGALLRHGSDAYKPVRCIRVSGNTATRIGLNINLKYDVRVAVPSTFKALLSREQVEIVRTDVKSRLMQAFKRRWARHFIKRAKAYTGKNGLIFRDIKLE
jgi:hypothetical protein